VSAGQPRTGAPITASFAAHTFDRGLPRALEASVAAIGLLLALPLMLICAAAIAATSPGPVLFRQKRMGRRGKTFDLWKLRTMTVSSQGPAITAGGDTRVTAVGRFLRAWKLDELPALWNVVRGDLSLVGPRPEVPQYVDRDNPLWRKILRARPGLTDPVTLTLRHEEQLLASAGVDWERFYRETLLPYKLRGSLDYLDRRSAWTDIAVLLRTVAAVLAPGRARALTAADLAPGLERPEASPAAGAERRSVVVSRLFVRLLQRGLDIATLTLSFSLAYLLRFDFALTRQERAEFSRQLPYVLAIQVAALALSGVYSFLWRYVGLKEVKAFFAAALGSAAVLTALRLLLPGPLAPWRVPLSVTIMDAVLAFSGVLGLRVARRIVFENGRRGSQPASPAGAARRRVLLLGAGQAGILAAREILGRGDMELDIRGFVDDDPAKQDAVIHGVRVLGTTRDLARLVRQLEIGDVVITIARISRKEIVRLIDLCRKVSVNVRIIPGLYEILQGNVRVSRIRDVEIGDLLGRDRVDLDEAAIGRFLAGKRVAITGAGGSIGSELARQVARFAPSCLLLLERAEFALFEIEKELRRTHPDVALLPLVADVGDEQRIRKIFQIHAPQVLLHAAAHKHVPMMERNPAEAIKNNVLATRLLGQVAGECGLEAFVLISTDKAVRPASVMGASKRVAELVVQDLARRYPTRFVAVRFGNVMGSAGSVIPIFQEQIRRGGPVTVTHPEMKRYFMTIPEAAQLVLQAGTMGRGGEIFILDMGEPVRILDLAKAMISLSGCKPLEEMEIVFTGLRPGEKLSEELELAGERIAKTHHPKILIGRIAPYAPETLEKAIRWLSLLARDGDGESIREFLNAFLPEASLTSDAMPTPVPDGDSGRRLDQLRLQFVDKPEAHGSLSLAPL
jgi:FlaA1/EpsC-like NDP-sugar epimerase/lipopolysaccharide/colanic/teichoic acid biosynthesis glycosyltransferase